MADIISTDDEDDTEGPPPYPDPFPYPELPPNFGKITCIRHSWKEGDDWGLQVGDFTRGEVAGDDVWVECHTSEKDDIEDLQGTGHRIVVFELQPGQALTNEHTVQLKVRHLLSMSVACHAVCNVEKDPPVVSGLSRCTFKQFDQTSLSFIAETRADKQTVLRSEKVVGTKSSEAEVEIKVAPGNLPTGNLSLNAQNEVRHYEAQGTTRGSISSPDSHQMISSVEKTEALSRNNLRSEPFVVAVECYSAAAVGDATGFADALLKADSTWILEATVLDGEGQPVEGAG